MNIDELKNTKCIWQLFDLSLQLVDDKNNIIDTINIEPFITMADMKDYLGTFKIGEDEYDVNITYSDNQWHSYLYKVDYTDDYICGEANEPISIPFVINNQIHRKK